MRKREMIQIAGIPLRFDGTWPNGWGNWTILSGGPGGYASFTVKPGEDPAVRAHETLRRFLKPHRQGTSSP